MIHSKLQESTFNIMRYKRIGYNADVMRQSACLMVVPIRLTALLRFLITCLGVGVQTV